MSVSTSAQDNGNFFDYDIITANYADIEYGEEWSPVTEVDNGMGNNPGQIHDEFFEVIEDVAEDMGVDYDPIEDDYEIVFSEDNSTIALVAPSWGGAEAILAETTGYIADGGVDVHGGGKSFGKEVQMGSYSDIEVNRGVLAGAADYLDGEQPAS
jgi:hypothetical protein